MINRPWDAAVVDEWLPRRLRARWGGSDGGSDSGTTTGGGDWGSSGSYDASSFNADAFGGNVSAGAAWDAQAPTGGGDWGSFGATNYSGFNVQDPNNIDPSFGMNAYTGQGLAGVTTGGGDWGSAGTYSAAGTGGGQGGSFYGGGGGNQGGGGYYGGGNYQGGGTFGGWASPGQAQGFGTEAAGQGLYGETGGVVGGGRGTSSSEVGGEPSGGPSDIGGGRGEGPAGSPSSDDDGPATGSPAGLPSGDTPSSEDGPVGGEPSGGPSDTGEGPEGGPSASQSTHAAAGGDFGGRGASGAWASEDTPSGQDLAADAPSAAGHVNSAFGPGTVEGGRTSEAPATAYSTPTAADPFGFGFDAPAAQQTDTPSGMDIAADQGIAALGGAWAADYSPAQSETPTGMDVAGDQGTAALGWGISPGLANALDQLSQTTQQSLPGVSGMDLAGDWQSSTAPGNSPFGFGWAPDLGPGASGRAADQPAISFAPAFAPVFAAAPGAAAAGLASLLGHLGVGQLLYNAPENPSANQTTPTAEPPLDIPEQIAGPGIQTIDPTGFVDFGNSGQATPGEFAPGTPGMTTFEGGPGGGFYGPGQTTFEGAPGGGFYGPGQTTFEGSPDVFTGPGMTTFEGAPEASPGMTSFEGAPGGGFFGPGQTQGGIFADPMDAGQIGYPTSPDTAQTPGANPQDEPGYPASPADAAPAAAQDSGAPPAAGNAARSAAAEAAARGADPAEQANAAADAAMQAGATAQQAQAIAGAVYDAAANQGNLAGPDVVGGRQGAAQNQSPYILLENSGIPGVWNVAPTVPADRSAAGAFWGSDVVGDRSAPAEPGAAFYGPDVMEGSRGAPSGQQQSYDQTGEGKGGPAYTQSFPAAAQPAPPAETAQPAPPVSVPSQVVTDITSPSSLMQLGGVPPSAAPPATVALPAADVPAEHEGDRADNAPVNPNAPPPSAPSGSGGNVTQSQAGIRSQAITNTLNGILQGAGARVGVDVNVTSGGQPSTGTRGVDRTGSHRHDVGRGAQNPLGAADLQLRDSRDGHLLDMNNPQDRARMEAFARAAVQLGATGIGAGVGYMGRYTMHIGGGPTASWGGAPWIGGALRGGLADRGRSAPGVPHPPGEIPTAGRQGVPLPRSRPQQDAAVRDVPVPPGNIPPAQPGQQGGQPGRSYVNGMEFSFYAPGAKSAMEGKFVGSRGNPLTTLDDVRQGKSQAVTLAGHPDQFGKQVFLGDVTYKSPIDGKTYTLPNVTGIVGDTGGDFMGNNNPNQNKYDIAVGNFRGWGGARGTAFVGNNSVRASAGPTEQVAAPPVSVPPTALPPAEAPPTVEPPATVPPARGTPDQAMLARTATQIAQDMAARGPRPTSQAEGQAALTSLAQALGRAGIPAAVAARTLTEIARAGARAAGYDPDGIAAPFISSMSTAAMKGYQAAPFRGEVQGPPSVRGLAKGGHVDEGETVMVGEEGPEYFVPDEPGTVLPYVPRASAERETWGKWPRVAVPGYPGRFAHTGLGNVINKQNREAQNPIGSLLDLADAVRINPQNWNRMLADPRLQAMGRAHIEDRRNDPYF